MDCLRFAGPGASVRNGTYTVLGGTSVRPVLTDRRPEQAPPLAFLYVENSR